MPQINNLEQFAEEIENLLRKFRQDPKLEKKTLEHQKNLEKLLDRTNSIIGGSTKEEREDFNTLLKLTENSYKQLKEQKKEDETFRKTFKNTFGEDGTASLSKRVFKNLQMTLSDVSESVKVLNRNVTEDAKETALSFFGGPLGRMATEAIDFSGIRNVMSRRKERKNISGVLHGGIDSVPREGTYVLDRGERVFSKSQNQALTDFVETAQERGVRIFGAAVEAGYFDELSESLKKDGIKVHDMGREYRTQLRDSIRKGSKWQEGLMVRQHRESIDNLRQIDRTIERTAKKVNEGFLLSTKLYLQRFMRHPILGTLYLAAKPLAKFGGMLWRGLVRFLVGKRLTVNEKILKENQEQTELMRTGQIGRRGWTETGGLFGRIGRGMIGRGAGRAERLRQRRESGETLTRGQEKAIARAEKRRLIGSVGIGMADMVQQKRPIARTQSPIMDMVKKQDGTFSLKEEDHDINVEQLEVLEDILDELKGTSTNTRTRKRSTLRTLGGAGLFGLGAAAALLGPKGILALGAFAAAETLRRTLGRGTDPEDLYDPEGIIERHREEGRGFRRDEEDKEEATTKEKGMEFDTESGSYKMPGLLITPDDAKDQSRRGNIRNRPMSNASMINRQLENKNLSEELVAGINTLNTTMKTAFKQTQPRKQQDVSANIRESLDDLSVALFTRLS